MTTTEPNTAHLKKAESAAKVEWWRKLLDTKRKPEGVFDGDTGKFTPSEREAPLTSRDGEAFKPDLTPRSPRYFTSRDHLWSLVSRACRGEPVPVDIEEGFKTTYGKIHERRMLFAVKDAMKREDEQHVAVQREAKQAAKVAAASTTAARIAHKEELIKNLQRKVRGLTTKIKKHQRSISALKRAAAQKEKTA